MRARGHTPRGSFRVGNGAVQRHRRAAHGRRRTGYGARIRNRCRFRDRDRPATDADSATARYAIHVSVTRSPKKRSNQAAVTFAIACRTSIGSNARVAPSITSISRGPCSRE